MTTSKLKTAEIMDFPLTEAGKFSQAHKNVKNQKAPTAATVLEFSHGSKTALGSNKAFSEKIVSEKISSEKPNTGAWSADDYHADAEGFKTHIAQLSKMEARNLYLAEATCHRNMLQRSKAKGVPVHDSFKTFTGFLAEVGPMPFPGCTLDRIKNNDPKYEPGKVRWATATVQNNNKSDNVLIYDSQGNAYTVNEVAKEQGKSPATIRQRRYDGWTDAEILAGKRETPSKFQPSVVHELFGIDTQAAAKQAIEKEKHRCRMRGLKARTPRPVQ